jgi:hypothetical protein
VSDTTGDDSSTVAGKRKGQLRRVKTMIVMREKESRGIKKEI